MDFIISRFYECTTTRTASHTLVYKQIPLFSEGVRCKYNAIKRSRFVARLKVLYGKRNANGVAPEFSAMSRLPRRASRFSSDIETVISKILGVEFEYVIS